MSNLKSRQASSDVLYEQPQTHKVISGLIFGSRWLQLPLYVGLILAQAIYVVIFLKELWHLITHAGTFGEQQIMLGVLALIDVVMISNLLVMVIVVDEGGGVMSNNLPKLPFTRVPRPVFPLDLD